ncbi:MAG: hypothetical protein ACLTD2_05110 [Ruminococcus sp.]
MAHAATTAALMVCGSTPAVARSAVSAAMLTWIFASRGLSCENQGGAGLNGFKKTISSDHKAVPCKPCRRRQ